MERRSLRKLADALFDLGLRGYLEALPGDTQCDHFARIKRT